MTSNHKQLIRAVEYSLNQNPNDWEIGEYRAVNEKAGIAVWRANSWYGVYIETGAFRIPDDNVTFTSSFFGWATWRGRIIRRLNCLQKSSRAIDASEAIQKLMGAA